MKRRGGLPAGVLAGCSLGLVAAFVFLLFPYERYRNALARELRAASGAEVTIGGLEPGFGWSGPALVATAVQATWPGGERLDLERARVRLAWSASWLRGRAAWRIDLRGPPGRFVGTWWPGPDGGIAGTAHEVRLDLLPLPRAAGPTPLSLAGRAEARVDVSRRGGSLRGDVRLEARDGAIAPAGLATGLPSGFASWFALGIPFDRLQGHVILDEAGAVELRRVVLEGPMMVVRARGRLRPGGSFDRAPLEVEAELQRVAPVLRPTLAQLGIELDPQGRAALEIRGSLADPALR